jgi:hypothetical protein
MNTVLIVLLLLALLCLILAALNVAISPRLHLGWLGVAILALVYLIGRGLIG